MRASIAGFINHNGYKQINIVSMCEIYISRTLIFNTCVKLFINIFSQCVLPHRVENITMVSPKYISYDFRTLILTHALEIT